MGYEQDYIKRLIEKLGEVLARALGLGAAGQAEEGLRVLEQGVGSELGMPFAMLQRLDGKGVISLLGRAKATAFAEALRARSQLFGLAGREQDARASAARASEIEQLLAAG